MLTAVLKAVKDAVFKGHKDHMCCVLQQPHSQHTDLSITASLMGRVYDSYKDKDGFLYMCYRSEKTFG
jgi:hypothetical protein